MLGLHVELDQLDSEGTSEGRWALFGHLYLYGGWSGMDLRTDTKKTSLKKRLDYVFKFG